MDKRVILTMTSVILISIGLIGFRVMTKKECMPPVISFEPANPGPGQTVKFICSGAGEDPITWNFGDSTPTNTGNEVQHSFSTAGVYTVKASLWEKCENEMTVKVAQPRTMSKVQPFINVPSVIFAGEKAVFSDATGEADSWSWKVLETGETGSEGSFAPVFPKPGKYGISLSVKGTYINGDTAFIINVIKRPVEKPPVVVTPPVKVKKEPAPAPPPPPVAAKKTTDAEFTTKFIRIANALKERSSDAMNQFRDEIVNRGCGNPQTMMVEIVKEGSVINTIKLERFKRDQLASGAYMIIKAEVIQKNPSGCISKIKVTVQ